MIEKFLTESKKLQAGGFHSTHPIHLELYKDMREDLKQAQDDKKLKENKQTTVKAPADASVTVTPAKKEGGDT